MRYLVVLRYDVLALGHRRAKGFLFGLTGSLNVDDDNNIVLSYL